PGEARLPCAHKNYPALMRIPQCHAEAVHRGAEQFLFSLYRFFDQPYMTAVVSFSDFVLAGL
ncbi:hypothetical protein ACO3OR_004683, partial [Escherichia coli]